MKRILCTIIVLTVLLTGCSAPVEQVPPGPEPGENAVYGEYEFTFSVESLSGQPVEGWEFVYIYSGEKIQSGHRILFSTGVFTFHSVRVEAIEKAHPENSFLLFRFREITGRVKTLPYTRGILNS